MATITRSGASSFPLSVSGAPVQSITGVTLGTQGDLVTVKIRINPTGITVASVGASSGGMVFHYIDSIAPYSDYEYWAASVTAAAAGQTVTISFGASSSLSGQGTALIVDEFHSSLGIGAQWTLVNKTTINNDASTTVTFPSVTSASVGLQMYDGYMDTPDTWGSGNNPINGQTFTYTSLEGGQDVVAFNGTIATSSAYQPTGTQGGSTSSSGIGAIWIVSSGTPLPYVLGNFLQFMSGGAGNSGSVTPPPPSGTKIASYTDPQGNWEAVTSFGSLTGAHMTLSSQYCEGTAWTGDNSIESDFNYLMGLLDGMPYNLALSIYLAPTNFTYAEAVSQMSSAVSTHTYVASQLASLYPETVVRLNWEINADTVYANANIQTDPTNYATLMNEIAPIYRGYGHLVDMNFNPAQYYNIAPVIASVADVIDVISTDNYDQDYTYDPNNEPTDAATSWNNYLTYPYDGLNAINGYCVEYGKYMAFPEWGGGDRSDGHSLGDDPYYVNQMFAYMNTYSSIFLYQSWFNGTLDADGWNTTLSDFPNMLAAYQANV